MDRLKRLLGLDFGYIPAPYPRDTPARQILREAVARGIEAKMRPAPPPEEGT